MSVRRSRSLLVIGALTVFVATAAAQDDRSPRPTNVLFLFADDMRPDAIAAWGNEHIATPQIDSLVERGFSFRHNYCMGSRHGAVCAPSRAMLMSGRTLHNVDDQLTGVTTLPQTLRASGYATFGTGKWHNGRPAFERSFEFGRSVMFGGMSDHNAVPIVDMDSRSRGFSDKRAGAKHSSELFADAAIDFLGSRRGDDEPFFCYVAFTAPHDPRDPPLPYRERYYRERPPLPPNFRGQHGWMIDQGTLTLRDEALAEWPRDEGVVGDQLAEYYGLITHLDDQLGRVLAALEASGHAEDTLIVFAADHGLAVGSHGLLGKQSLYEHSMGCPLILAGPGVSHGSSDALTYLLDLYPTVAAVCGVEVPGAVEGKDLGGIVRGESERVRESLFTLYAKNQRAVRDARYKLIRFTKTGKTLLFDLAVDPHEMRDLAGDPEHEDTVARLLESMVAWQRATGDRLALVPAEPLPERIDLSGRARKPDRWQPAWIRKKYFGIDSDGELRDGGK